MSQFCMPQIIIDYSSFIRKESYLINFNFSEHMWAKAKGIKGISSMKKADLIAALS